MNKRYSSFTPGQLFFLLLALAFSISAQAQMRITEWMYTGNDGEFVEFTNVGNTAIDMTGWSYDDDSQNPGTVSLSAFGTVQPGESVILTETAASTFRTAWGLCAAQKVIGGNTTGNMGRNDEINLFDASNTLVDRLTYGDEDINGSIRTQDESGWVSAAGLGNNNVLQWTLSSVNDAEGSYASTGGDIGSPGKSTRATVSFDPCIAQMRITEWMYSGDDGEFVEFTNVGNTAIDMTGWSYDDDSQNPGTVSLSAFGMVQPGESVILTETAASTFRTAWGLCAAQKVIGGNTTGNMGRNDEINLYNASNALIDRLTYGDQNVGGIRTQDASGWVSAAGLGNNDVFEWTLSTIGDAEGSYASTNGDVGSPGKSTRATVSFAPCAAPGGTPTIEVASTTTAFLNMNTNSPGSASGVISDPTDPAATLGIDFTIDDSDTPLNSLTVTATSSNQSVVSNGNLNVTGSGGSRNLTITPTGVGLATITVTVSDGSNSSDYLISYAASAASVNTSSTRFHTGASDASTAIAIDNDYMFVANDEDQIIRLYDRDESGYPLAEFDFTSDLALSGGSEVDIEASARLSNTIYWMGSHGNNSSGEDRPNRERIFSTVVLTNGANSSLSFLGYYRFLEDDLIAWDNSNGHNLGAGFLGLQASAAPGIIPELDNGFNIEGLVVAPNGNDFYVAFRAPLQSPTDRTDALIIPVTNLTTIVNTTASSGSANFGDPIFLDLGGRGIRSIDKNTTGEYLIVAGPTGGSGSFKLYTWTGDANDAPVEHQADLSALMADGSFESIVELPNNLSSSSVIPLLVDNGGTDWYNTGQESKELQANFQKFRSETIELGSPVGVNLSGTIAFARNNSQGVKDATVTVSGSDSDTELTAADGSFAFTGLTFGGNFTFSPDKTTNINNGLTVGDALAIQQHVANINLLSDPFDLIAADVDGGNSISILDAVLTQQSILNNVAAQNLFVSSWRFVPQSHNFSSPPWGFPTSISLNNVISNQTGLDFFGIKVGDVVTSFANPANLNSEPALAIHAKDQQLKSGSVVQVTFYADQTENLAALQLALQFDPEVMKLTDIQYHETLPLDDANFGMFNIDQGELRAAWTSAEGVFVNESAPLFTLNFEVYEGAYLLSEVLTLEESILPALCYNGQIEERRIDLSFDLSTDTQSPLGNTFAISSVFPNPFNGQTNIAFEMPGNGDCQLRVFDVNGRLVKETNGFFQAGPNNIVLDLTGSDATGLLYFELLTPFGSETGKLLRQ